MALFNRKKEDAPAPAASEAQAKSPTNEAFDFNAISRDLDAQGGASSFDSLLSQPATQAQTTRTKDTDSAFDFPENDPLGLSSPPVNPPPHPTTVVASGVVTPTPDTVINAPMTPPPMPATGVAPAETAPVGVVPKGVTRLKGRKSSPLIPILGALGLLAVAGGGAMFFLNSSKEAPEPEVTTPVVTRPRVAQNPAPTGSAQLVPSTESAPPATGLRSASPGIAPAPLPVQPVQGAVRAPVRAPQNPAQPTRVASASAPSATGSLDPAKASRLKALWKVGADAKHRNDFAGARKAWQQALQLVPGHPGFQESINKLPS